MHEVWHPAFDGQQVRLHPLRDCKERMDSQEQDQCKGRDAEGQSQPPSPGGKTPGAEPDQGMTLEELHADLPAVCRRPSEPNANRAGQLKLPVASPGFIHSLDPT